MYSAINQIGEAVTTASSQGGGIETILKRLGYIVLIGVGVTGLAYLHELYQKNLQKKPLYDKDGRQMMFPLMRNYPVTITNTK